MATIEIKLDLDWIGEDMSLDQHIKNEVISNLQKRFVANVEKKTEEMLKEKLTEAANRVTDEFLKQVLSNTIEHLMIPYKESTWDSNMQEIPLSKFVGKKYERFLNQKTLDERGNVPDYSRDAKYTIIEYFTNRYLEKELTAKVGKLIQKSRQEAEDTVIKTLEQNLREQLGADLIGRLNIPSMLKSLQEKAVELQGESEATNAKDN